LLSWISLLGPPTPENEIVITQFQSLLSWISLLGYRPRGHRMKSFLVSILVVLDQSARQFGEPSGRHGFQVSILVVLDQSARPLMRPEFSETVSAEFCEMVAG
jgi:hypothetical protein